MKTNKQVGGGLSYKHLSLRVEGGTPYLAAAAPWVSVCARHSFIAAAIASSEYLLYLRAAGFCLPLGILP